MTKNRTLFTLSTLLLFAAVAVFPGAVNIGVLAAGKLNLHCSPSNNSVTLTADGGDPQPRPVPLPKPPTA